LPLPAPCFIIFSGKGTVGSDGLPSAPVVAVQSLGAQLHKYGHLHFCHSEPQRVAKNLENAWRNPSPAAQGDKNTLANLLITEPGISWAQLRQKGPALNLRRVLAGFSGHLKPQPGLSLSWNSQ